MPDQDPKAKNAMRYPKVIDEAEIDALPRLEFNTGIDTAIFISRERDDARYFRHGYCYMEPDHGDYHWDQSNFDESHFCLEGRIKLIEQHGGRRRMRQVRHYFPGQKPYRMVYCEDPFGNIIELYSHSYELTYSAGAYA